ncbi:unnamed protein product [Kuraishia capsulata CBS 1993]|uniref:Uncharacterized protein n=1 Tax=Kuraishia capsulata CBS 1993 TaxID=1382522 RepID=W6MJP8_9ASCO|nr:uncharacterized protein KUCA_T00002743001 [Kuraishia capsulata CBS 1993]CDK26769.1 unnamed protein product [Kuraishia capsulata CBS 1993]
MLNTSNSESDSDSSFDEFVEEQEQQQEVEPLNFEAPEVRITPPSNQRIDLVMSEIFNESRTDFDSKAKSVIGDRCRTLLDRLVQHPKLIKPNWRKSLVRRQLFLELGIPIDLDEILNPSTERTITNIYGESELSSGKFDRVHSMLKDLDLSVTMESGLKLEERTYQAVDETEMNLQTRFFFEESHITEADLSAKIESMKSHKSQLLILCKEWMNRRESVKSDNAIFESYIENMVANTQRFRRLKATKK